MQLNQLTAISPIDGRYFDKTKALSAIFSEFGLMKYRILIEVVWFNHVIFCGRVFDGHPAPPTE